MSDLAETIWAEFEHETEEHLQHIASILSSDEASRAGQVDQLFRSFHSLKGLSRVLGLLAMETTAHHAENVLGLVRDGNLPLNEEITHLLLAGADALAVLREQAVADRSDGAAPDGLLSALSAVTRSVSGAPDSAPEPEAAGSGLHDDEEMLALYVENMQEWLPVLAFAIAPDLKAHRDAVDEALEILTHGAEMLELGGLQDTLGQLSERLPQGENPPDVSRLVGILAELREHAAMLTEMVGVDSGAEVFSQRIATALDDGLAGATQDLISVTHGLADPAECMGAAAAAHWRAEDLHARLRLAGADMAADLAIFLADLYSRIARAEIPVNAELARLLLDASMLLAGLPDQAQVEAVREEVRRALGMNTVAEQGAVAAVADLALPPELVEILLPENYAALGAAMARNENFYAVLLFPEQNQDTAGQFISWLNKSAVPVTNRTVLRDDISGFEFLIHSALRPDQVVEALKHIDPTGKCIGSTFHIGTGGSQKIFPEAAKATAAKAGEQFMRVPSAVIHGLVTELGEVVTQVSGLHARARSVAGGEAVAALDRLAAELPAALAETLRGHLNILAEDRRAVAAISDRLLNGMRRLDDTALELRVVPIEPLFVRLGRSVRDLAAQHGKQINFTAEGQSVRIDKMIVDRLGDPLLHMIRNSVDHGIEPPDDRVAAGKPPRAEVWVKAVQRGAEILIEVGDTGRGLNVERIKAIAVARNVVTAAEAALLSDMEAMQLIFRPGFSTTEKVTETSGRGVGMDVVLTATQSLGGDIDIQSHPGQGTKFILRLPLSASMQAVVIVEANGQVLAIPDRNVEELKRSDGGDLAESPAGLRLKLRGSSIPVFPLADLLTRKEAAPDLSQARPLLLVSAPSGRIGLLVDRLLGRQSIYLKDLHPRLARVACLGGAAVQADGSVLLVLDCEGVVKMARHKGGTP